MVPLDRALASSYKLLIVTTSLTAAVWPQFATQVFRGGIGRLTCIESYVNKQVTIRLHFGRRQEHVRIIILGQLWTQVASAHHEYGRLTLATVELLSDIIPVAVYNSFIYLFIQFINQQ